MKRVVSLILAISMLMSVFTFSFAGSSFKDIDGTNYEVAVEALVELGIVDGYEDGTYRPEKNVSRAEMAKLLVVAAGLEPAAKLAEGTTKFADVNGGWASGYVNVASEYSYIVGYPDGKFRPDDTVSYAEAVTMAVRVLGYKTVVESKGTWPTNYIEKAEDEELVENVTFRSYNDGATRGNVAILIWNMLKTPMWEVMGETDVDGLEYYSNTAMLNVKFPDYSYAIAKFVDFDINGDGNVEVELNEVHTRKADADVLEQTTYVYEGLDFYTFVPGTEVEVLVNEKDEVLLTMVATGKEKLVEGDKLTIDEEYDAISGDSYDYAYGIVEKKEITHDRQLKVVDSQMIFEKTEKDGEYIKLNKEKYENDEYDYEVIIKDGERATINDVEVGDVLTEVKVDNNERFFMVSRDEAEGKLTKYVVKKHEGNNEDYHLLTVGGEEYLMDSAATYVEDSEDEDEKQTKSFASSNEKEDMKGEVVTLIRDFLGRVVRVEFDGSIDEETKEVKFFVVTEEITKEGVGRHIIGLQNKDESDTFKFAKTFDIAKTLYNSDDEIIGTLVAVELNDDDEITNLMLLARAGISGDSFDLTKTADGNYVSGDLQNVLTLVYDEEKENGEYRMTFVANAKYDDKNEKIGGINADESVIVISLLADDNGTAKELEDDIYFASFDTGLEAVDAIRDEEVLVIVDAAETFKFAKFVVRFGDNSTREDELVGLVEEARINQLGDYTITIDGETYTFKADENKELVDLGVDKIEGAAILFSLKTKKEAEEEYAIVESYVLENEAIDYTNVDGRVEEISSGAIAYASGDMENFKETFHDKYDDYLFVRMVVDLEEEEIDMVEDPVKGTEIDAKFFNEDDGILYDDTNKVVWVIEGLDWPEEVEDDTENESGDKEDIEDENESGDKDDVEDKEDIEDPTTVKFLVVSENIAKENDGNFSIGLTDNENNLEFMFEKNCNIAKELFDENEEIIGTLVAIELNGENEILDMTMIARAGVLGDSFEYLTKTTAGNYKTDITELYDELYKISFIENAQYESGKIGDIDIDENVVVVSLISSSNGTDAYFEDDMYFASFENGLNAIENVDDEEAIIITNATNTKIVIKFQREYNLTGIIEEARKDQLGNYILTIDGETYVFKSENNPVLTEENIDKLEGAVIFFKTRGSTDENGKVLSLLLEDDVVANNMQDKVIETATSAIAISGDKSGLGDASGVENFKETFHDKYDEYSFIRVVVDEEGIDLAEEPVKGREIDASFFEEEDGIIYDTENKVVWVIEGLDWTCQHTWDEGVQTKAPTTTETGIKTYTCTLCGETKTEEIPVLISGSVLSVVKVGDYVTYESDEGITSWRVFDIRSGEVLLTPASGVVGKLPISGLNGYLNGISKIEAECDKYTNSTLGITENNTRSMTEEDINRVSGYIPTEITNGAVYYSSNDNSYTSGTITSGEDVYIKIKHASNLYNKWTTPRFYVWEYAENIAKDENGVSYAYPTDGKPVYLKDNIHTYDPSLYNHVNDNSITVGSLLGSRTGWIVSKYAVTGVGYAIFGMRHVNSTSFSGWALVSSVGGEQRNRFWCTSYSFIRFLDTSYGNWYC